MTTTLYRRGRVRSPQDPFATALLVDGAIVAWVGSESAADAMSADTTVDLEDAMSSQTRQAQFRFSFPYVS